MLWCVFAQIIEELSNWLWLFCLQPRYIQRLKAIRATLEHSEFFQKHEIIGSSLLFLHDRRHASCWLIDFAKTDTLPDDIKITHKKNWEVGNHEDGYLIGLNNIIDLFTAVAKEMDKQGSDQSSSESSGWKRKLEMSYIKVCWWNSFHSKLSFVPRYCAISPAHRERFFFFFISNEEKIIYKVVIHRDKRRGEIQAMKNIFSKW